VLRGERFTHANLVVGHDPHRIRKQKSMNAAPLSEYPFA
jgi:hypothetical protein